MDIQKVLKTFYWDTTDIKEIDKMLDILNEPEYYEYTMEEEERLDYIEYLENRKKELE